VVVWGQAYGDVPSSAAHDPFAVAERDIRAMVSSGWWPGTPPQQRQHLIAGRMLALPDGSWWIFGAWGRWYRLTPADAQWHLCPPPQLAMTRRSARPLHQGMAVPPVPPHVVPTGPDLAYAPPAALAFVDAGIRPEITSRVRATVESAAALPTHDYPHWWKLFSPSVPSTVAVTWGVMLWCATAPVFDARLDAQMLALWSSYRARPLPDIDGPRWLTPPPLESLVGLYTERLRSGRVDAAVVILRTMWAMAGALREDSRFQPRADALIAMLGVTLQNPTVDYGALSYGDQAVVQQWLTRCPPALAPALRVEASAGEHFRNSYYDLALAVTPIAGDPASRGYVEPRLIAAALLAADLAVVRQDVANQVIGWLDPQVGEAMRAMLIQRDHPLRPFWPEGDRLPRSLREGVAAAEPAVRSTLLATMYAADLAWCRLGGNIPARPRGFPSSVAVLAEIIGPKRATSATASEPVSHTPGIAPLAHQYPANPAAAPYTPGVPMAQQPPTGPPGQPPAWTSPASSDPAGGGAAGGGAVGGGPAGASPPATEAWAGAQPWPADAGRETPETDPSPATGARQGESGLPASAPPRTEAWPGTEGAPTSWPGAGGSGGETPSRPPPTEAWPAAEGADPGPASPTPPAPEPPDAPPPPRTEAWPGADPTPQPSPPPPTQAWPGTAGASPGSGGTGSPPATRAWPGTVPASGEGRDSGGVGGSPPATRAWPGTGGGLPGASDAAARPEDRPEDRPADPAAATPPTEPGAEHPPAGGPTPPLAAQASPSTGADAAEEPRPAAQARPGGDTDHSPSEPHVEGADGGAPVSPPAAQVGADVAAAEVSGPSPAPAPSGPGADVDGSGARTGSPAVDAGGPASPPAERADEESAPEHPPGARSAADEGTEGPGSQAGTAGGDEGADGLASPSAAQARPEEAVAEAASPAEGADTTSAVRPGSGENDVSGPPPVGQARTGDDAAGRGVPIAGRGMADGAPAVPAPDQAGGTGPAAGGDPAVATARAGAGGGRAGAGGGDEGSPTVVWTSSPAEGIGAEHIGAFHDQTVADPGELRQPGAGVDDVTVMGGEGADDTVDDEALGVTMMDSLGEQVNNATSLDALEQAKSPTYLDWIGGTRADAGSIPIVVPPSPVAPGPPRTRMLEQQEPESPERPGTRILSEADLLGVAPMPERPVEQIAPPPPPAPMPKVAERFGIRFLCGADDATELFDGLHRERRPGQPLALLIVGDPHTGQRRLTRLVARTLAGAGVGDGSVRTADGSDLRGDHVTAVTAILRGAGPPLLFERLDRAVLDAADPARVVAAVTGAREDKAALIATCDPASYERLPAELTRVFQVFRLPDLTNIQARMALLHVLADERRVTISAAGLDIVRGDLTRLTGHGDLVGARLVEAYLDRAVARHIERAGAPRDRMVLVPVDFVGVAEEIEPALRPPRDVDGYLRGLEEMIGLEEVKRTVGDLVAEARAAADRATRGLPSGGVSRHLIFVGRPGTGKATVAGLIGGIYAALNLLDTGQLVVCGARDFATGDTAAKVAASVDRAMGGVLFIEDAYLLDRMSAAVDELSRLMRERRDEFMVICASRPDEMEGFLRANPGFRAEFGTVVEFGEPTERQLVQLFSRLAERDLYMLDEELRVELIDRFAGMRRYPEFAFADTVRRLFDQTVARQAARLSGSRVDPAAVARLTVGDLPGSVAGQLLHELHSDRLRPPHS
jgi:hypothetical protein